MLKPICFRQTQHTDARGLGGRLKSALMWWSKLLDSNPRTFMSPWHRGGRTPDMVLYTDAEGSGGVGAILIGGCGRWYLSSRVPERIWERLKKRKTQINVLELLAWWTAIHTWKGRLQGQRVVSMIDNTCAMHMAIKGASKCEDANEILHDCWLTLARGGVDMQIEYVNTKDNGADGPSRGDSKLATLLEAEHTECDWPEWPCI